MCLVLSLSVGASDAEVMLSLGDIAFWTLEGTDVPPCVASEQGTLSTQSFLVVRHALGPAHFPLCFGVFPFVSFLPLHVLLSRSQMHDEETRHCAPGLVTAWLE